MSTKDLIQDKLSAHSVSTRADLFRAPSGTDDRIDVPESDKEED